MVDCLSVCHQENRTTITNHTYLCYTSPAFPSQLYSPRIHRLNWIKIRQNCWTTQNMIRTGGGMCLVPGLMRAECDAALWPVISDHQTAWAGLWPHSSSPLTGYAQAGQQQQSYNPVTKSHKSVAFSSCHSLRCGGGVEEGCQQCCHWCLVSEQWW